MRDNINLTLGKVISVYKRLEAQRGCYEKTIYYQTIDYLPRYDFNTGEEVMGFIDITLLNPRHPNANKVLLLYPDQLAKYKDDIERQGYELVEYI